MGHNSPLVGACVEICNKKDITFILDFITNWFLLSKAVLLNVLYHLLVDISVRKEKIQGGCPAQSPLFVNIFARLRTKICPNEADF